MDLLGTLRKLKNLIFSDSSGDAITIAPGAQSADRVFTLPVVTGDDTFVTAAVSQSLSNKTIPRSAGNTVMGLNDAKFTSLENVTGDVETRIDNLEAVVGGVSVYRENAISSNASYTFTGLQPEATIIMTNSGARSVYLPSSPQAYWRRIVVDGYGNAGTNNITIYRAGSQVFEDGSTSKTLNENYGIMEFEWDAVTGEWITRLKPAPTITVNTPSISSPANGATGVSSTVTITSSAFSISQGSDTHQATHWQISGENGFTRCLYDKIDPVNLTSLAASAYTQGLNDYSTYYVRCKYISKTKGESAWSSTSSFTVAAPTVTTTQNTVMNKATLSLGGVTTQSISAHSTGFVAFAATTEATLIGTTNDWWVSYVANGAETWKLRLGKSSTTMASAGLASCIGSSGDVYLAADSGVGANTSLVKINSSGTLQWSIYASSGYLYFGAYGMKPTHDGGVVGGYGTAAGSPLIKINSSGSIVWQKYTSVRAFHALGCNPSTGHVLAGYDNTSSVLTGNESSFAYLQQDTGAVLWATAIGPGVTNAPYPSADSGYSSAAFDNASDVLGVVNNVANENVSCVDFFRISTGAYLYSIRLPFMCTSFASQGLGFSPSTGVLCFPCFRSTVSGLVDAASMTAEISGILRVDFLKQRVQFFGNRGNATSRYTYNTAATSNYYSTIIKVSSSDLVVITGDMKTPRSGELTIGCTWSRFNWTSASWSPSLSNGTVTVTSAGLTSNTSLTGISVTSSTYSYPVSSSNAGEL